jgi:hypothetical protein
MHSLFSSLASHRTQPLPPSSRRTQPRRRPSDSQVGAHPTAPCHRYETRTSSMTRHTTRSASLSTSMARGEPPIVPHVLVRMTRNASAFHVTRTRYESDSASAGAIRVRQRFPLTRVRARRLSRLSRACVRWKARVSNPAPLGSRRSELSNGSITAFRRELYHLIFRQELGELGELGVE